MKKHPKYNNYLISEEGRIFIEKDKELKEISYSIDRLGYLRVKIKIGKYNRKTIRIHRLVAETYLENPNNYPQVNHIDENKLNNNVSNLEWVTNKQNAQHSKCKYFWKILNLETGDVYETNSLNDFCNRNDLSCIGLHSTLPTSKKIKPHYKGYKIVSRIEINSKI